MGRGVAFKAFGSSERAQASTYLAKRSNTSFNDHASIREAISASAEILSGRNSEYLRGALQFAGWLRCLNSTSASNIRFDNGSKSILYDIDGSPNARVLATHLWAAPAHTTLVRAPANTRSTLNAGVAEFVPRVARGVSPEELLGAFAPPLSSGSESPCSRSLSASPPSCCAEREYETLWDDIRGFVLGEESSEGSPEEETTPQWESWDAGIWGGLQL